MLGQHLTQEQADEYAVGAMEPGLARLVLLHVDACDVCRDVVEASERAALSLALAAPLRRPSRRLRRKVLRAAGISRPSPMVIVGRVLTAFAGVAAVTVAIAAFTGMVSVRSDVRSLRGENAALRSELNDTLSQKVEIAALGQQVEQQERDTRELRVQALDDRDLILALSSPNVDVVDVITRETAESAIGRLVWDKDQKKVWFVADGLPRAGKGQTYQIWVHSGGRYVSLGTFNPDESGFARYATLVPQGLETYDSVVVTIETAGGALERTGPSVFVTDLSRLKH